MTQPKLASAQSGLGGRGYRDIFGDGGLLPSVTTVLNAIDRPGILQWSLDQQAAWMAVNAAKLLDRDEEQAFRMGRFLPRKMKSSDFDDPMTDLRDSSSGVLNDLAELGDAVHEWIEADLTGGLEPDIFRIEQEQMIVEYLTWKQDHDIEVLAVEKTVYGDGYAGTFDSILRIDGVATLVDNKTSRAIHDTNYGQLGALSAAHTMATEVPKGTEGAVEFTGTRNKVKETSYWVPEALPPIQQHAILRLRPDDYDNNGNFVPAFCRLEVIDQRLVDAGYEMFRGALQVRLAQRKLKDVEKILQKELF